MKKILFITYSGTPTTDTGGPSKVIDQLIRNLSEADYQIEFFSGDYYFRYGSDAAVKAPSKPILKQLSGFLYKNFPLYKKLTSSSLYLKYYFKRKHKAFNAIASVGDWDIIHAHDPLSLSFFCSHRARKILTIHYKGSTLRDMLDFFVNQRYLKKNARSIEEMENQAIVSADIITFPSRAALEIFAADKPEGIFNSKDVRIIYNGVEMYETDIVSGKKTDDSFIERKVGYKILNVAQHIRPKNLDILIRTIYVLKNEYGADVQLLNIGEGPETASLLRLIRENSLENEIQISGPVPNTEIMRIMKCFKYFVMPSERVIFDMVILEALASGMIVIASDNGGNKEVITDGYNGYLVKDPTPEILARTILNARCETAVNALESVKNFSIRKTVSEFEKLYY